MKRLDTLFQENEDWLMNRVLSHAKSHNYTKYTSTLEEAWRLSISGLTASLGAGMKVFDKAPELEPDDDFSGDPISAFGILEARRHRKRGVTLGMFLGLMKYYRQSYIELLAEKGVDAGMGPAERYFVDRCFDRFEVAFAQEWVNTNSAAGMEELQTANRIMTNEKNTYLTVFESLSDPVLMLDRSENIINLNHAAAMIFDPEHVPGGHYYHTGTPSVTPSNLGKRALDLAFVGRPLAEVFPWLIPTIKSLRNGHDETTECEFTVAGKTIYFEVKCSDMLDVSEKFTATVIILSNITNRKLAERKLTDAVTRLEQAMLEVKKLTGLLPMCANCKKVRDDKGYWSRVEEYISRHTDARFSHGICPDCAQKLYPQDDATL